MTAENDAERQENEEENKEEKDSSEETPKGEVDEKNSNSLTGVLNAKIAALAIAALVVGILIGSVVLPAPGVGLFALGAEGNQGLDATVVNEVELKAKVQDYISENLLTEGATAIVDSLEEINENLSLAVLTIENTDSPTQQAMVYVTNDGSTMLIGQIQLFELDEPLPEVQPQEQPQAVEVQKSDKPIVEVFVMTYCPYGLQIQKAVLPVMELLGSKADIETKFVSYIMHDLPEIQENTVQYCIQKEQNEKYFDYLNCFVVDGDSETCLANAGVNTDTLGNCIAAADAEFGITAAYEDTASWLSGSFPVYAVHKELNELYGVQGSPALVINGTMVSAGRSPEAVKQTICSAFNEAPAECSEVLSSTQAAPSFGSGAGDGSEGYC